MVKGGEPTKTRRSKRQAGLEVSPPIMAKSKKLKKSSLVEDDDNIQFSETETHATQEAAQPDDDRQYPDEADDNEENEEYHDDKETEEEAHHTAAETVPPSTNGASVSMNDVQTQQSEAKKKNTRGPTTMHKVSANFEDKVEVEFNKFGEHVGKGSVSLSSFLGPLVREHVPVLLKDWRHLNELTRETMWEEIQGRFNLKEGWQKEIVFKQMGCIWRSSKSRLTREVIAAKSKTQLQSLKPSNIQSVSVWNTWVKKRTSSDFKVESEKYRELRLAQIPHTTSRKGMTRLADEMMKKSSDPSKVTRSKVWIAGHTHSDGTPVREEYAETIIRSIDSEMDSNSTDSVRDDAVSQVLGCDKPGRLRGMGRGATVTKLAFLHARDSHVQKLEATQAELLKQLEELRLVVSDLAAKKDNSHAVSQSELSDVSKGVVIRCQLLDWVSDEDVIVGEGLNATNYNDTSIW